MAVGRRDRSDDRAAAGYTATPGELVSSGGTRRPAAPGQQAPGQQAPGHEAGTPGREAERRDAKRPAGGPDPQRRPARHGQEQYHGQQAQLFGDESGALPGDVGYRGPTACSAAGITYRQLDYWARTGLVEPSVRPAHGSGSQRLYSFRDILVLKVVKRLLDTGISLQQIRAAVQHLRDRGADDLAQVTLMSDGVSVYECTSADEVVDLLQGGQGVFGIALGKVWREVEGTLAELPPEAADGSVAAVRSATDELAHRRARRTG